MKQFFNDIINDIRIFYACKELRHVIMQVYATRIIAILTLILTSPILLIGCIAILFVYIFDFIGQTILTPFHKLMIWLDRYATNQIHVGHSILTIEQIKERLGDDAKILPKDDGDNT